MRISDWSSDVCSSDLARRERAVPAAAAACLLPMEVFPIRSAGTVRARQAEDLCDRLGSVVHREFPQHDGGLRADALDGSRSAPEDLPQAGLNEFAVLRAAVGRCVMLVGPRRPLRSHRAPLLIDTAPRIAST